MQLIVNVIICSPEIQFWTISSYIIADTEVTIIFSLNLLKCTHVHVQKSCFCLRCHFLQLCVFRRCLP